MRIGAHPPSSVVIDGLLNAMRLLPRAQQLALRRYYCNGESDESICAELGLDLEEFCQLRRNLKELYRHLAAEPYEPVDRRRSWAFAWIPLRFRRTGS